MNFAWSDLNRVAQGTIICAVLGFVLTVQTTSLDGDGCRYTDYGALVFGAMTAVLAGLSLRSAVGGDAAARAAEAFRPESVRVVGIAGLVVALIHLLRGLGILFGPC